MNKTTKTNLFIMIAGLIAIAIGIFFTVSGRQQAARDTEPAVATVIEYSESEEYDSTTETYNTVYYPVLSYEVNGETVVSQYSRSDADQSYKIGESLNIKYNPDNPEEFIIDGDTSAFKSGSLWVIPAGAVIFLIGLCRMVIPIVVAKKKQREEN